MPARCLPLVRCALYACWRCCHARASWCFAWCRRLFIKRLWFVFIILCCCSRKEEMFSPLFHIIFMPAPRYYSMSVAHYVHIFMPACHILFIIHHSLLLLWLLFIFPPAHILPLFYPLYVHVYSFTCLFCPYLLIIRWLFWCYDVGFMFYAPSEIIWAMPKNVARVSPMRRETRETRDARDARYARWKWDVLRACLSAMPCLFFLRRPRALLPREFEPSAHCSTIHYYSCPFISPLFYSDAWLFMFVHIFPRACRCRYVRAVP